MSDRRNRGNRKRGRKPSREKEQRMRTERN